MCGRSLGDSSSSKCFPTCKRTDRLFSRAEFVAHRSVAKFQNWGISVAWSEAWNCLRSWRFVRPVQDTSCLSFHGILPTADRLHRFGMRGQPEDLIHLFTSRHFARAVLDWFFQRVWQFRPSMAPLSHGVILFGFPRALMFQSLIPPCLGFFVTRFGWPAIPIVFTMSLPTS